MNAHAAHAMVVKKHLSMILMTSVPIADRANIPAKIVSIAQPKNPIILAARSLIFLVSIL